MNIKARFIGIQPETKGFIVNSETGTVEWDSGLNTEQIAQLKQLIGVEKPNLQVWNSIKRHIDIGVSVKEIAKINHKKPGYSEAQIKRFSAAYSKINGINKSPVSKNNDTGK